MSRPGCRLPAWLTASSRRGLLPSGSRVHWLTSRLWERGAVSACWGAGGDYTMASEWELLLVIQGAAG